MESPLWYCCRPPPSPQGQITQAVYHSVLPLTSSVFAQFMLTISVATPSSYCLLDGKSINGGQGQLIPRSISCSRKEIIANLQSDRCISILMGVIWPKHLLPLRHNDAMHRMHRILLLSHVYTDISFTYMCKLAWYLRYLVIYCNYTPSRSSKAVSFMHIIPLLVMTRIIFAHQVFSIIMSQGSCPMLLVGTFHAWKYDSHPFPWNTISDKRQAGWETGIDFYGNTVTSASQPTMGQSGWYLANLYPCFT